MPEYPDTMIWVAGVKPYWRYSRTRLPTSTFHFQENLNLVHLYIAVSFPPFLHKRAWRMFRHNAVTRAISFPSADLPAFIGAMTPSDFICSICLPPFIISCPAYSLQSKKTEDIPGCRTISLCRGTMVSNSEDASPTCHLPTNIFTSVQKLTPQWLANLPERGSLSPKYTTWARSH